MKQRSRACSLPALVGALSLAACAPAPLYTAGKLAKGAVTRGEIPRDAMGEPVWSAIHPLPAPTQNASQNAGTPGNDRPAGA